MNFVTWAFVILFIIVLACRVTIGRNKTGTPYTIALIAASTVFCAWHVPRYVFIMLTSIVIDYWVSIQLARYPFGTPRRRWLLALSVMTNIGLLGFFKYTNFLTETFNVVAHRFGLPISLPQTNLILPMGISFYTFCSMSYTIDVYRNKLKPVKSFSRLYLFLTYFPHLVAGPIVRAENFLYQIDRTRSVSLRVFTEGGFQIVKGLFLKLVCADNLATVVSANWDDGYKPGANGARLLTIAVFYSFQIFCDFEGYTSIARGLSYLLGYRLPLNFDNPYLAESFSNFWQRWHISLSRWLRDYLYLPLGGNKVSPARTYLNLMIVMVLGGLWHGANLTFLAWGTLHGLALVIERFIGFRDGMLRRGPIRFVWYLMVQVTVLIGWILFRSANISGALMFIKNIITGWTFEFPHAQATYLLCLIPPVAMHVYGFARERSLLPEASIKAKAALAGVLLIATVSFYGVSDAFIYFQF